MRLRGLLVVVALPLSACSPGSAELSNAYSRMEVPAGEPLCITTEKAHEVCIASLVSVVANPQRFGGRTIQVVGFVTLRFEDNALYLSREAAEVSDSSSAVWLDVGGLTLSRPQDFDRRYVILAGRFNAENRGHLGMFAGTIETISRLERWPK